MPVLEIASFIPFLIFILIFIFSMVFKAKKAMEEQQQREAVFSKRSFERDFASRAPDPDLVQQPPARPPALSSLSVDRDNDGAIDKSALTTGGAKSVKAAHAQRRKQEKSAIRAEKRAGSSASAEERVERLFQKYPKQAILASEILGPPRSKRPIRG